MTQKSQNFKQAFSLHQSGKLTDARDLYIEILSKEPENHEVLDLLGVLYYQAEKYIDAINCIKKAIDIKPEKYYYENLARVYFNTGKYDKVIEIYDILIKTFGEDFENCFNMAMAYKNLHKLEDAKKYYQKAQFLDKNRDEIYFNLAAIYLEENNPQKAVEYYKKTIELKPDDWESEYFLSLAYMQSKDYAHGLKCFESRLCRQSAIYSQSKTYPELTKQKPLWEGQDITGKTLYTYYEAGFGDIIMFYRFMPELTKICKKIIFKPQKELVQLFKENSYGAEIMETIVPEKDLDFDFHAPFLSIPYLLGKDERNIFIHHNDGYLKANPEKIKYYKEKFFNNDKFKIGIKWQGNTFYEKGRVLNVEDFFPLFEIPNTQFYSCQTYEGSQEFEKIKSRYDVIDLSQTFTDFSYTAAAIDNMDLIICNDTSLAHLAGAMKKPCIVLLPYVYNWRWHTDLSKCDWYDSVKIFRQKNYGNWTEVFAQVEIELRNCIKA